MAVEQQIEHVWILLVWYSDAYTADRELHVVNAFKSPQSAINWCNYRYDSPKWETHDLSDQYLDLVEGTKTNDDHVFDIELEKREIRP